MGTTDDNVALGFILVTAAGLATAIGAAFVYSPYFVQVANKHFLAGSLGLSAGVMLFVSFIEIFFKSNDAFIEGGYKENEAYGLAMALFFAGILMMQVLDWVVHHISDYHEDLDQVCKVVLEKNEGPDTTKRSLQQVSKSDKKTNNTEHKSVPRAVSSFGGVLDSTGIQLTTQRAPTTPPDLEKSISEETQNFQDASSERLRRMGIMTALAIGIHNLPEGLATFLGALDDPAVGGALAVAIGIHNIPEGLCVAIPIFYATGSRHKAFFWALLSGITEPIGAAIGYAVVVAAGGEISQFAYGILFGLVSGMMVSICIKELLPTAHRYDPKDKYVTTWVIIGMVIMALSLLLFTFAVSDEGEEGD
mmetsp:Transcript_23733/g.33183  ORF Transcript_23733/g.33183 Transcript_23733/m.33183 type:complete len:363 (-) Transcript_23733:687-1775(-)|eukprot:CAMPEP_0184488500 /NCGR_PEP_ID=MMETSP0113_2-20130426/12331_1 /TAXON_ID=91329 /ORGANISM="Norrisiella sphaerica, Strain BC52" /LENGTH=362 /DNA_ID=CAMNT_0026871343 /DNA_START=85 /DNA_END=1173 /DNA_ORIENTATION=+